MADYRITLTVEADDEIHDPDSIADALVGEVVDVGVHSLTIVRVERVPEPPMFQPWCEYCRKEQLT